MLKPGDIVTDRSRDHITFGKQGEVIGVQLRFWEEPEILVKFDRACFPFDLGQYNHMDETINFVVDIDVLALNEDWEPDVYAKRVFGDRWHSVRTYAKKFDATKPCMVENCPHNQTDAVWINIWGTVFNVYICKEHATHYRKWSCMDSFPFRKESA